MKQKEINKKNKSYVGADDTVRPLPKRNPLIKQQSGITVVALVITIIIMLILAGVTVKIATGGGIIDKTKNESGEFEIEQEKEKVKSGYLSYISAKMTDNDAPLSVEDAKTTGNATSGWTATFTKTNNEYKLTKDGKVILTKQNGIDVIWTDNGNDTFTKGDVTLKVGDIVNYDEGTGYSTTVEVSKSGYVNNQTYTTENLNWRVLGINAKGELELISDNPTSKKLYLKGERGYLNAEDILNNMCNKLYGQGEHATGARSLNVEDINKLGNYDPTTKSGYGDIWTYRFPTSGEYIQSKVTKTDGTLVTDWTNITNTDFQTFRMPGETEKISADNRNDTGRSVEYTSYSYTVEDKVKQTTSDGKNMSDIISKGTGNSYDYQWLASRCAACYSYGVGFYGRHVGYYVDISTLYYSNGSSRAYDGRVRPVVTLKTDIQLTGNSTDGWTIE